MSWLFTQRRDAAICAVRWFSTLAGAVCLSVALAGCDKRPPPDASSAASAPEATTAATAETTTATKDPLALPAGDLDDETIANYLHAAMDYKRPDQFSKGFNDAPLVGRHFKIYIPSDKEGERGPTYYYDTDKEQLTLTVEVASGHQAAGDFSVQYLTFVQESSYGASKLESNAFNVTKEVTPVSYRVIGIGALAGTYIGLFPNEPESMKSEHFYRALSKTLKLDPSAAKAAVEGLTMEVEGTVIKDGNGHAITCSTVTRGATMDHTLAEDWRQCVLSAKLTRITVSSPNAGVLAQWGASGRAEHKMGLK